MPGRCRNHFEELGNIPITKVTTVKFSTSGQHFAVAATTIIFIYTTATQERTAKLKGHVSAVTALHWSTNDSILLSASAGGAVYYWDLAIQRRILASEYVDKLQHFAAAHLCADAATGVVRSLYGEILMLRCGAVQHTVAGPKGHTAPMVLAAGERLLFAGTEAGEVHCWPWPAELPAKPLYQVPSVTHAHAAPVAHMRVAGGGSILVTAATDGTIIAWSLQVRDASPPDVL